MNIAVTGASGFVGRNLIEALSRTNHHIRALIHRKNIDLPVKDNIEFARADIHDTGSLLPALKDIDVVYHLVGIIVETRRLTFEKTVAEGTLNLVDASLKNGVKKIIYLSALGTSPDAGTMYHKTKWQAEESVRNSGLEYVILRPSIIFGPGDKSLNSFARLIKMSPVIPIIGDGEYMMQPVFIEDLTYMMVDCLDNEKASGKTIEIGGPERLQFKQIIDIIKKVLRKRRIRLYIPAGLIKPMAGLMEKIVKPAPVTTDQIEMLLAGNVCEKNELYDIFDIRLTPLEEGLNKYLR